MRKFLQRIYVIQVYNNKGASKIKGRGFLDAKRLNPYNPFSYITIVILFLAGVLMFGFVGVWKEVDKRNPFKWY